MVTCTHCDAKNSLDSKFCKGCGKALEREAIEQAQASLEDLVAQGFRSLNDGQVEEAALIAESALADDPSCTSALSLKAMCCEREGRIADALEFYERVLALKPDSTLDRIKVTHLRNTIAGKLSVAPPPPDRKTALIGALAATVLVVSVGVAIAGFVNRGADTAKDDLQARTTTHASAPETQPLSNQAQPGDSTQAPNNTNAQAPANTNTTPNGAGNGGSNDRSPILQAGDGRIPSFDGNAPVILKPNQGDLNKGGDNGDRTSNPPTKGGNDNENDPPILPDGSNKGGGNGQPPKNNGIIDIRISNPQSGAGGATNLPDEKQAVTLVRAGLQQYQTGKYANSARSFEAALRAGADPGRTNQRLAQAYDKLGQTADSIAAYTRAIASLEAQVKSGKGGAGAQASLDSCKAALQVLKGGS